MGLIKVMVFNITRHRFKNQRIDVLLAAHKGTDLCSAHGHRRHGQAHKALIQWHIWLKMAARPRRIFTLSYTYCSELRNLLPIAPLVQGAGLVFSHQQKQLSLRPPVLQDAQGVDGVAGADALDLLRINLNLRQVAEAQASHGQPVVGSRQWAGFVPGLAGGDDKQAIQAQMLQRGQYQGTVSVVRRVKRAAKDADSGWTVQVTGQAVPAPQAQSRGTKNRL